MNPVDAYTFLCQLDFDGFVLLFWYIIVFDFSRYTLSIVAVLVETVMPKRKAPPYQGPVSVLLVGHNEGDGLGPSISSMEEQTHRDLQIVVVDDGSSDNMAEVGSRLKREGRIDTFISTGLRGGKAGALNLGLRYCVHSIVATCDIDTSFDRDAIERLGRGAGGRLQFDHQGTPLRLERAFRLQRLGPHRCAGKGHGPGAPTATLEPKHHPQPPA